MIQNIKDEDEEGFLRHWSERVYDRVQLAQIAEIERQLVEYATTAWLPTRITPPVDVLLIGACEDGVVLMSQNQHGEWRTSQGMPHKPPRAWMLAPPLPPFDGRQ